MTRPSALDARYSDSPRKAKSRATLVSPGPKASEPGTRRTANIGPARRSARKPPSAGFFFRLFFAFSALRTLRSLAVATATFGVFGVWGTQFVARAAQRLER